jgi:hypothetical protein
MRVLALSISMNIDLGMKHPISGKRRIRYGSA